MFKVLKIRENRINIEISGKLDKNEMAAALDELFATATNIEHGHILFRVTDFSLPTLGALGVEFSRFPEAFRFIKKFDRAAILADEKWVRKISEIEGAFIPGLTIKAFDLTHETEAEYWLDNEPL